MHAVPPPAAARHAGALVERALAHQRAALRSGPRAEAELFAADVALLDARTILLRYRFGRSPSPLADVGLADVATHIALAYQGPRRHRWTLRAFERSHDALVHLRRFR
jgi:hypothetical protein